MCAVSPRNAWIYIQASSFTDVRFALDNVMKMRTSQGIGITVKKDQILTDFEEDLLWSLGLLGTANPQTLLNTVVFLLGKGCVLCAGKEHRNLRGFNYNSQFQFLHDNEGHIFVRYTEDIEAPQSQPKVN